MNCKSFDRLIGSFIENRGEIKESAEFIRHMDACESCRKDFETDFYAFWGLKMLGDPDLDSYDIQEEMDRMITDTRTQIKNDQSIRIIIGLLIAAACIIVLFIILNH